MIVNPENRRQADRRYFKTTAMCQRGRNGLGEIVTSTILNVSATGAQLLVRGNFDENEEFYLALVSPRRTTIAELKSTVRWRKPEGPSVFRLGVSFDRPLTDGEIAEVV